MRKCICFFVFFLSVSKNQINTQTGFDSSANDVQAWAYDAADSDNYVYTVTGYSNAIHTANQSYVGDWKSTVNIDNAWANNDVSSPEIRDIFVGKGMIPKQFTLGIANPSANTGFWAHFVGGEFSLAPPKLQSCDMLGAGTRLVKIDPAGTGTGMCVCRSSSLVVVVVWAIVVVVVVVQ